MANTAPPQVLISLKATLDKETRRVAFPTNLNLSSFKLFIAQLFNVQLTAADNVDALIQFQYKDDESDWIKVGTEQEWSEALRIAVAKGILRVKITKKKSSIDPTAILNDLGKDCKKQWETNVAPHLTELSKQCENLKNDPRTKQVQDNVDKFFDELGAFVRKQEKELPQQMTNWFNQVCAAFSSPAKQQQQQEVKKPEAQQDAPQQIAAEAPVLYPIEEQQEPVVPQVAAPAPAVQQDMLSSSMADFVVIQNELASQKPIEQPVVAPVVEQPAPVVAAPEPAPAVVEPAFAYAEAAEVLQNMGFSNVKLNQHLLTKFKGDIARALDALLQLKQHN